MIKKVTNFIRAGAGRGSVPVGYNNHAAAFSKSMENLYKVGIHQFDVEKENEKQDRPVVFGDAEDLLQKVIDARGLQNDFYVKVMADGGQGFFKICMSVLPLSNDESEEETEPSKKRSRYCEGGSFGKSANLDGVKKVILLCIVPKIKETYYNLNVLFHLINLNNIPCKFASDFKVILIINGQQTATATYPCPFCLITSTDMDLEYDATESDDNESCYFNVESFGDVSVRENCLKLKTFGDLRESHKKFVSLGSRKVLAKHCQSTINAPLFDESDDTYVIQKIVIPELHELQGIVNYIFWKGIVPLLGRENALKWPSKLNVLSKDYHGEIFEGNQCRVLLKHTDKLYDKDVLGSVNDFSITPLVMALKSLNKLVDSCFTTEKVHGDYKKYLLEFENNYKATGLPLTLKVHVLIEHLENCLSFLDGYGLGRFSEQTGEGIHREFLNHWNRFKINNIFHENYGKQLKRAVVDMSSKNL